MDENNSKFFTDKFFINEMSDIHQDDYDSLHVKSTQDCFSEPYGYVRIGYCSYQFNRGNHRGKYCVHKTLIGNNYCCFHSKMLINF